MVMSSSLIVLRGVSQSGDQDCEPNRVKSERHIISLIELAVAVFARELTLLALWESNPECDRPPSSGMHQLRSSYCDEVAF